MTRQMPPAGGPGGPGFPRPPYGGGQQPPFGGGQQPMGRPPQGPPPSFTPQYNPQHAQGYSPYHHQNRLRYCLHRYTYIWLNNGRSFWYYPVWVDRTFVYGYRWEGYYWDYRPINLNRIIFSNCY